MPEQVMSYLTEISDLRHRVRRLRWFRETFKQQSDEIGRRFHFRYAIDERVLVSAFFRWATTFERERPYSGRNRRDFAIFAAGLMLRELGRANPASKVGQGQFDNLIPPEPMAVICEFWPEGYLYATYCLRLVQAILAQDFDVRVDDNPHFRDVRLWELFRENFSQDPDTAIGFFDVFMGVEPNWSFPQYFSSRPAVKAAILTVKEKV